MKKQNLLFVFTDQWRRSALGIYDDEPVITPNMDEFARKSVVCTDCSSACPLCSPARGSIISGLFPLHTGIFTNCKNASDIHLRESDVCIGDVLKENGYQTGYIGKWHLDEPETNHDPNPISGARDWDAYTEPGPKRHGFDFWHVYNACDQHTTPHYWEDTPQKLTFNEWSPIHETDVALNFLEKRDRDKPFALFLAWNPPHSPYSTAPQKNKDQYKDLDYLRGNIDMSRLAETRHHTYEPVPQDEDSIHKLTRDYFAAVTGLDDQFGRIMEYMDKEDLMKDTIVVLTADHGDMLGSHTLIGKHVWYEESIGIPFVIGGAGIHRGKSGTVFSSQDIPSTLISLLNLEVPSAWDGKDISKDILLGTTDEESYTYIVACPGRDIFIKAFEEAGKDIRSFGWRGIRTRRYTFVIEVGYEVEPDLRYYLYDNRMDHLQMHPLLNEEARENPVGRRLEKKLISWLEEQHDGFVENIR